MSEVESKIKEVMSNVLDIEASKINENFSKDDTELWDSMNHINIVVALEEEFDINFSEEEIPELLNFKIITLAVNDLLKNK